MRQIIIIIALVFSNTISLAGTIRPDVDDQKYIEYGEKHKCVLKIKISAKNKDTKISGFASCTIIKPRIAITAAHVVKDVDEIIIVREDNSEVKVKYSVFPALFTYEKIMEKYDIALCYLEEPIELTYYPDLYRSNDEEQKICSIAGFGMSGTYDKGVTIHESKKRAGSNTVDAIINDMIVCTVGKERLTSLEYLIAEGDSGGGLFIDKKLAGINSNVATIYKDENPNSDMNDFSFHTRVSNHVEWIDKCIEMFDEIDTRSNN